MDQVKQEPSSSFQLPDQQHESRNEENTTAVTTTSEPVPTLTATCDPSMPSSSSDTPAKIVLDSNSVETKEPVATLSELDTSPEKTDESIRSVSEVSGTSNNTSEVKSDTISVTSSIPTTDSATIISTVNSLNGEEDNMTIDTSSDEEDDGMYANRFSRDNMNTENNELAEELVVKRNSEYLQKRCSMLMQRVQAIMLSSTALHVTEELQSISESPALNPILRPINKNVSYPDVLPRSQRITKQSISELQFSAKLMKGIIQQSMGRSLNPNEDSATEESDTDDDEIVLPADRICDLENSDYSPYLPVENNPFIGAVNLEKTYETRKTTLDFTVNECDYSLTKAIALKKHCKVRKPCFQLEKPPASCNNFINIPVDAASSVKLYHDSKPATIKRVSDMLQHRNSTEEGTATNSPVIRSTSTVISTSSCEPMHVDTQSRTEPSSSCQKNSQNHGAGSSTTEERTFTIKTVGEDGKPMLRVGVEFAGTSDPNLSASRCAAIRRPEKNRKVFQLGGIQNIFRDPVRLPTIQCNCFGRDELCALCLGRTKKRMEINHIFMNNKDKLAILDETFHKSLSFSEDIPLDVLLMSGSFGAPLQTQPKSTMQQLIKARSHQFPPSYLETGPRPKKPRSYGIKPYVESPIRSPKKENRFGDETLQSQRKRSAPRKSQSSFDERDNFLEYAGKGFGWSRERKDSLKRTRNQEYDIDNIVIPYSMAATTRVETLVYKPIETPSWRILEYDELFESLKGDDTDGELEDMSNATFAYRHQKCEVEEKKRFTTAIKKALNTSRKTRRLDSTCRSDSISDTPQLAEECSQSSSQSFQSLEKGKEDDRGSNTPQLTDSTTTVITEAMANQALKSLFKVGRRRTVSISSSSKVEEEEEPVVVVDPWPQRRFPLVEEEYQEMLDAMQKCYTECPVGLRLSPSHSVDLDSPCEF